MLGNRLKLYSKDAVKNFFCKKDLYFIVEPADWIIRYFGLSITGNLKELNSSVTTSFLGARNSLVHYGSGNTLLGKGRLRLPHKSNKVAVTWFHVSPGDERISLIKDAVKKVNLWHTASSLTKRDMIKLGIPGEKIEVIPLGIDTDLFSGPNSDDKNRIREEFGIPLGKFVIGSFQKDGVGWGEGLTPKTIKGPDIFCDVMEKVSEKHDIFVLLTGPARGYVKQRLKKAGISFLHYYFKDLKDVARCYKALDLYMITSRVEGGPQSILESMASGTPLITAKVGMAPDVIRDGDNGFLVDVGDVPGFTEKAYEIIESQGTSRRLSANGLEGIKKYEWKNIAEEHYKRIYSKLRA